MTLYQLSRSIRFFHNIRLNLGGSYAKNKLVLNLLYLQIACENVDYG